MLLYMSFRILIVDESPELRNLLKFPLLYAGFEILEAQDALEAIGLLEHQHVDLVVTDWEMPQMNGLELTIKIRQHTSLAHLPIILLLNEHQYNKRFEVKNAGVTETLLRPNDLHRLVEKVKNLVVGF